MHVGTLERILNRLALLTVSTPDGQKPVFHVEWAKDPPVSIRVFVDLGERADEPSVEFFPDGTCASTVAFFASFFLASNSVEDEEEDDDDPSERDDLVFERRAWETGVLQLQGLALILISPDKRYAAWVEHGTVHIDDAFTSDLLPTNE